MSVTSRSTATIQKPTTRNGMPSAAPGTTRGASVRTGVAAASCSSAAIAAATAVRRVGGVQHQAANGCRKRPSNSRQSPEYRRPRAAAMTKLTALEATKQPNASQGVLARPAHKTAARRLSAINLCPRQAVTSSRGVLIVWLIDYCSVDVRNFKLLGMHGRLLAAFSASFALRYLHALRCSAWQATRCLLLLVSTFTLHGH